MRRSILIGILFVGLLSFTQSSRAATLVPIEHSILAFQYVPFGMTADQLQCKHYLENELSQDWKVDCYDSAGRLRKRYRVHLWLSQIVRDRSPRMSLELLYWVTDLSPGTRPSSMGTTLWFHFVEKAPMHSLSASQSVENETAALVLEMDLSGVFK